MYCPWGCVDPEPCWRGRTLVCGRCLAVWGCVVVMEQEEASVPEEAGAARVSGEPGIRPPLICEGPTMRWYFETLVFVLLAGLAAFLCVAFSCGAGATPAPLPRHTRPNSVRLVPGRYVMFWGIYGWHTRFNRDGTYEAGEGLFTRGNVQYRGRYYQDGDVLYLREWSYQAGEFPPWPEKREDWAMRVNLVGGLAGKFVSVTDGTGNWGTTFRLEPYP